MSDRRPTTTMMGVPGRAFDDAPTLGHRERLRLLVVEDNRVNQMLVRRQLDRIGHDHIVVDHAAAAIDILAEPDHDIDVVLMDRQLPDIDGLEATRQLRVIETDTGRYVPVIAVTASALTNDREACLEAGMDDFLGKPVALGELAAMIARWGRRGH